MSLHQRMKNAGLVVGHHESDLYVLNTPEAHKILEEYPLAAKIAQGFLSETGEGACLDIPFNYDPAIGD